MASILQEEQEFQEELDSMDTDTLRQVLREDTEDFISGSPSRSRSRRRDREGSVRTPGGASQGRASESPKGNGYGRHTSDTSTRYESRKGSESPREPPRRAVKPESRSSSSSSSSGEERKKKREKKEKERAREKERASEKERKAAEGKKEEGGIINALSELHEENKAAFEVREKKLNSLETGSRVRRNDECWQWGDQDGGEKNFGTVLGVDTTMGWVTVRWDPVDGKKGKKNNYRWGQEKAGTTYWDVELAPNAPPAPQGIDK